MTFSIVARSADGQALGVAVASKFLAVGAAVPAAEADVGALATQSYANLAYRPQGLALLRSGVAAADVVAGLTAADPGRAQRQLGVVGPVGDGAIYTGDGCHDWAGGLAGDGYAIQGNILAGKQVVVAMAEAWAASDAAAPLGHRLLAALAAGDRAGGGTSDVLAELRVDDHPDPVPELRRLLDLHALYFDKPDPDRLLELTGDLADEVAGRLADLGYRDRKLDAALASWAGVENLEERMVPGRIDPLVLAHLRRD